MTESLIVAHKSARSKRAQPRRHNKSRSRRRSARKSQRRRSARKSQRRRSARKSHRRRSTRKSHRRRLARKSQRRRSTRKSQRRRSTRKSRSIGSRRLRKSRGRVGKASRTRIAGSRIRSNPPGDNKRKRAAPQPAPSPTPILNPYWAAWLTHTAGGWERTRGDHGESTPAMKFVQSRSEMPPSPLPAEASADRTLADLLSERAVEAKVYESVAGLALQEIMRNDLFSNDRQPPLVIPGTDCIQVLEPLNRTNINDQGNTIIFDVQTMIGLTGLVLPEGHLAHKDYGGISKTPSAGSPAFLIEKGKLTPVTIVGDSSPSTCIVTLPDQNNIEVQNVQIGFYAPKITVEISRPGDQELSTEDLIGIQEHGMLLRKGHRDWDHQTAPAQMAGPDQNEFVCNPESVRNYLDDCPEVYLPKDIVMKFVQQDSLEMRQGYHMGVAMSNRPVGKDQSQVYDMGMLTIRMTREQLAYNGIQCFSSLDEEARRQQTTVSYILAVDPDWERRNNFVRATIGWSTQAEADFVKGDDQGTWKGYCVADVDYNEAYCARSRYSIFNPSVQAETTDGECGHWIASRWRGGPSPDGAVQGYLELSQGYVSSYKSVPGLGAQECFAHSLCMLNALTIASDFGYILKSAFPALLDYQNPGDGKGGARPDTLSVHFHYNFLAVLYFVLAIIESNPSRFETLSYGFSDVFADLIIESHGSMELWEPRFGRQSFEAQCDSIGIDGRTPEVLRRIFTEENLSEVPVLPVLPDGSATTLSTRFSLSAPGYAVPTMSLGSMFRWLLCKSNNDLLCWWSDHFTNDARLRYFNRMKTKHPSEVTARNLTNNAWDPASAPVSRSASRAEGISPSPSRSASGTSHNESMPMPVGSPEPPVEPTSPPQSGTLAALLAEDVDIGYLGSLSPGSASSRSGRGGSRRGRSSSPGSRRGGSSSRSRSPG